MNKSKSIAILGSTGSVGTQTLDVIAQHKEQFQVEALAGGNNIQLLLEQIHQFRPKKVSISTKELAEELKLSVPAGIEVLYGDEGLREVAAGTDADFVVTAVVGSKGLRPTLDAIEAGKTIGLANKETLVSGGHIVTEAARKHGVALVPIDSEHSAIFQCLNGERRTDVHKIVVTASGGSFRDRTRDQLVGVSVHEALQHPNWSMGAKITIDSATMMNKGLEVIEAHWLFNMDYDHIDVVIHPESIIHSYVEFVDHSIIAQLGSPDMRVPIQYALMYPNRMPNLSAPLDLVQVGKLHFRQMDMKRYPCMQMAYDSGRAGGTTPTVYNAANEVAVARFLDGAISFLDIEEVIIRTLHQHQSIASPDLEAIVEADQWARTVAAKII
ncbi:1-deoxy-D-xylulose-5-phosphate reductoisomerase [Paenibacillus albiflavus]|uniref:1-deoxy-D-xylulose 5-phosphate reductoisomerase n=1 Tax=Paenibacillus albiflavus TaxID=2545760 RepID=A0A4R4EIL4_9BACL|nr:1-deoxy-D-xylulose-5-phosphate reductoisomerase [Paenibacillus albiflavus]TCZ79996.1 1-deoxy-D-xylulose-5-phosphate reductoisomerase [Paenibacillus albiflavus]